MDKPICFLFDSHVRYITKENSIMSINDINFPITKLTNNNQEFINDDNYAYRIQCNDNKLSAFYYFCKDSSDETEEFNRSFETDCKDLIIKDSRLKYLRNISKENVILSSPYYYWREVEGNQIFEERNACNQFYGKGIVTDPNNPFKFVKDIFLITLSTQNIILTLTYNQQPLLIDFNSPKYSNSRAKIIAENDKYSITILFSVNNTIHLLKKSESDCNEVILMGKLKQSNIDIVYQLYKLGGFEEFYPVKNKHF